MDEEDKNEETIEEGDVKEASSIDQANEAAERLENANKDLKETLKKQEDLLVEQRLAGKSQGGSIKEPELSPEDFADAFMEGKENILMPK